MAASLITDSSDIVIREGPFGGPGGAPFSDELGEIVGFRIAYSDIHVVGLQISYKRGDTIIATGTPRAPSETGALSEKGPLPEVGDSEARIKFKEVTFEQDEYLVQVKGLRGPGEIDAISSLTFITSTKIHGPYGGTAADCEFQSSPNGKVIGIFGTVSAVLKSIGFFTKLSCNVAMQDGGEANKNIEIFVEHKAAIICIKTTAQDNSFCGTDKCGGSKSGSCKCGGTRYCTCNRVNKRLCVANR